MSHHKPDSLGRTGRTSPILTRFPKKWVRKPRNRRFAGWVRSRTCRTCRTCRTSRTSRFGTFLIGRPTLSLRIREKNHFSTNSFRRA